MRCDVVTYDIAMVEDDDGEIRRRWTRSRCHAECWGAVLHVNSALQMMLAQIHIA
jgi:hypothetical protein